MSPLVVSILAGLFVQGLAKLLSLWKHHKKTSISNDAQLLELRTQTMLMVGNQEILEAIRKDTQKG